MMSALELEMQRIVDEAEIHGICLRLLGGLAVKVHCPSANHRALTRKVPDMDFLTDQAGGKKLEAFFTGLGYEGDKTLNLLNGDRRQLYFSPDGDSQVDVFVGNFEMCHKLPVGERVKQDRPTLPLAELFLTKAQIVELNRKDAQDLIALLADHPVGEGDLETINGSVVADYCAKDWGLYTTVHLTLQKMSELIIKDEISLDPDQEALVLKRTDELRQMMLSVAKPLAWKLRDRVGTRMRWYEEVEEVRR
jgi:hypothetical protein